MKKIIASLLCLCVLLCGCGGNEDSSTVSESPVESAMASTPEETSTPAEVAASEEPVESADIPQDPTELGRWLFELNKTAEENISAIDMDVSSTITITRDGEETTTEQTSHVLELLAEDGALTYYASQKTSGMTSDIWYQDGMLYSSSLAGQYKIPIDQESFEEEYSAISELDGITADSYASISGEVTDTGYILTLDTLILDGSKAFIESFSKSLFSGLSNFGVEASVTGYTQSVTIEMDKEGYPIRADKTYSVTFRYGDDDSEIQLDCVETSIYNAVNSSIIIDVPSDDPDYKEMSLSLFDLF